MGDVLSGFPKLSVPETAKQSTCLKRITVCAITDSQGHFLAIESNRCDPPDGQCTRMRRFDGRKYYPVESECNWEHAEQRAVKALPKGAAPYLADLYGHDWPCPACEKALKDAGVRYIHTYPKASFAGLRVDVSTTEALR